MCELAIAVKWHSYYVVVLFRITYMILALVCMLVYFGNDSVIIITVVMIEVNHVFCDSLLCKPCLMV